MGCVQRCFLVLVCCIGCLWVPCVCQVTCNIPRCICLSPVGTFCVLPVQDLSGYRNRLPTIQPGSFSQASFVLSLNLARNNPLTLQEGSFQGLTNVTTLNLTSNQLDNLPDGVFSPMQQLTTLNLSNNSLTELNPDAFNGLSHLQILDVRSNLLGIFSQDLLTRLPSLHTLYLSRNPYNCSHPDITDLYTLLVTPTINVVDGSAVSCRNGTAVLDLDIDVVFPSSATPFYAETSSSDVQISPTKMFGSTGAILMSMSETGVFVSTEENDIVSTTVLIEATPTPQPTPQPTTTVLTTAVMTTTILTTEGIQHCPADVTLTYSGYLSWPVTGLGRVNTTTCPNGGGIARRMCMASGVWSESIEEQDCVEASALQKMLADLTAATVTEDNSEEVSEQLVSLPKDTIFSLQEIDTISSLAAELVGAGSTSVNVLNNTLQALDNVLNSSGAMLSQEPGRQLATRIREVIDSLLLDALNINQSVLILSFAHLAVGGAYLPATRSTRLIASIRILSNGNVVISVGGSYGDIVVDATGNSTVQVTVYEEDNLFQAMDCADPSLSAANETVKGEVLTPIISVASRNMTGEDEEEVTITYSSNHFSLVAKGEDRYVCARWNTSVNCGGGGWTTQDCSLHVTSEGVYQCRCLHQGIYTLLDIPHEDPSILDITNLPHIARIIFYILSASTIPFYLTILITILVHKDLRSVPAAQSLANQSASQGLTFLILVISYERDEVLGVCYGVGVVLQYFYLVSLSWMAVHPVIICIEIFKRLLYEKAWLIWPFVAACWSWPLVTVVYGGLRYDALTDNSTTFNCWLESALFPSTITYITAVAAAIVLLVIGVCVIYLRCSDYDIDVSTYLRVLFLYPNTLLFIGLILTQYFTAASTQFNVNPFYVLLGTANCAILCGSVFFISNGLFLTTIRNAIFCKGDPMSKNKIDKYATNYIRNCHFYDEDESTDSGPAFRGPQQVQVPPPSNHRGRNGKRGSTGQGMGYMNDYLAGQNNYGRQIANPVPLTLFGQMQLNGRVRGGGRLVGDLGANPAFNMDSTDA